MNRILHSWGAFRDARLWGRRSPEGRVIAVVFRHSSDDWKTLSWYLFRIREGCGSERRDMGSAFNSCVQDTVGL